MKFSLLIPSRERPDQLIKLLDSIVHNTGYIDECEIMVTIDEDEPMMDGYKDIEQIMEGHNFSLTIRERTKCHPDYYNAMALKAKGEILWALCDDCIIDTDKWDAAVIVRIQAWKSRQMEERKNYSIWYGDVGDTTRNYNNNGQYSCFPMMSKETFETLGYFFNPRIIAWGTDKFLKHVFIQSGAGIIDLTNITVKHLHLMNDETHNILINRLKSNAGQECALDYGPDIQRLKERIAQ